MLMDLDSVKIIPSEEQSDPPKHNYLTSTQSRGLDAAPGFFSESFDAWSSERAKQTVGVVSLQLNPPL